MNIRRHGFVLLTATALATAAIPVHATASVCGNAVVEDGEACDDGLAGALGSCCGADCTIRVAGFPCFFSSLPCQTFRTCDGVAPVCPAPASVDGAFCQYAEQACLNGQCEEEPGLAFVGFTGGTATAYSVQRIHGWTMDVAPGGSNEISYPDFTSDGDLFVVGSATVTGGNVRLTAAGGDVGAAWYGSLVPVVQDFTTTFSFSITDASSPGGIGDGFAFVIQRDMRGLRAVGANGQDLGFGGGSGQGLTNSVAVEFDTYQNTDEPATPYVSVQTTLDSANSAEDSASLGSVSFPAMTDGATHTATITYDATAKELSVALDSVPSLTVGIDLSTLQLTRAVCNDPKSAPRSGCLDAPAASLVITDKGDTGDSLKWKWTKGPAVDKADVSSPVLGTAYDFCVYDADDKLVTGAEVLGSGLCGTKACWKETGTGYKFKDKTTQYGGILGASIGAGDAGKSKASVKAKGAAFVALPNGAPAAPLTVQLAGHGGGFCAESTFTSGDISTNDGSKLKAVIK